MRKVSIAEASRNLERYVEAVEQARERIVITRAGRPVAVLMSVDELESIEETMEILSDPELMQGIRESEAEIARGEVIPGHQVFEEFKLRRGNKL